MTPLNTGNVFFTFLGAFIWAMFGYLSRQGDEKFQPEKLLSTFLAAALVAFLTIQWGIPDDVGGQMFEIFFMRSGIVAIIDKIIKAVWRRWLKDWWERNIG